MDSIIVGFSKPKSWLEPFSWVIRLVTWSPFSHAYIRFYDEKLDRWVIYQASGLKVNYIGQTMFDSIEDVCEEFYISVSEATKLSVLQGAMDKCGSSYAVGQIFGFIWILFMGLFGKKVNNPFYDGNSYFCSELVGDILEEIGLGAIDSSTMTPKDIRNFLVLKGFKPINQ